MARRKPTRKSKYSGVMSTSAFLAAARAAGVKGDHRERARRILVGGETVEGLARKDRLSVQTVYRIVRTVYRESKLYEDGDPNERYWPMLAPPAVQR